MSMDKPFRIEVTVDAPRDVVWRAISEPERIRHWFGWEYDGLEDEIQHIFVDHATQVAPERIDLGDHAIELEDLGDRTLIRVIKPGDAEGWEGVYGDIEEGWITFFNQLRHRLERHPSSTRRMIVRKAAVVPGVGGRAVARERVPARRGRRRRARDRLRQAAAASRCCSSPPTTSTTTRSPPPRSAGTPGEMVFAPRSE